MSDTHAVAVLGGGSFGTVVANIIARNGSLVRLWMRNEQRCAAIQKQRQNSDSFLIYNSHDMYGVELGGALKNVYAILAGVALGKGQPLDEILAGMDQVAEGINTVALLKAEADRREVTMPLVNGLYGILYERRPVAEVFDDMMHTEQAQDVEFVTR